jgi:hypothetical protein
MIQLKMFYGYFGADQGPENLEAKVNQFLRKHADTIDIVQITQNQSGGIHVHHVITVHYKPKG